MNPEETAQSRGLTPEQFKSYQDYSSGGFRNTQVADVGANAYISSPITASSLAPVAPINLPTPTYPTAQNEIIANTDAQIAQYDLLNEQKAKKAKAAYNVQETEKQGKSLLQRFLGVPSERARIEEVAGLTAKDRAVQDANRALAQSQRAQQNEIRAIESNNLLTKEQAAAQVREVNRKYAFEQADLSLSANFALNNYEAGVRDVDRKMKLITEPLEIEYKFYSDFLDNNRANLTKAEQNLLETRKESIKTAQDEATAIGEIQKEALKNGVNIPTSVLSQINKAKTAQEAYSILAANGVSLAKPVIAKTIGGGTGGGGGTGAVSAITQSVIDNPSLYYGFTPTQKAQIIGELQANGYDVSKLQNIKLSTSQQEDLSNMGTVKSLIEDVLSYQDNGVLPGIGYKLGSLKGVGAQLGFGSEEAKSVRANIGNIKGTIAKLRGGTSFTTNEEKLLNSYVPNVNDSSSVAINKLNNLKKFIDQKNNSLIGVVQINPTKGQITKQGAENVIRPEDLRAKYSY